jgi:dTDP-glucose pyrophosphorylase
LSQTKLVAVILAAGKGTRMQPFSASYPKPTLPICNKPLLQYQVEMFRDLGIEDIIVVIGHLGHEIAQRFGDGRRLGTRLRYVEQAKMLGIAAALGQLEAHVTCPMFVVLGDIFFKADGLAGMVRTLEECRAGAVLAVKQEDEPEAIRRNFTVQCNPDGTVRRVIEKPRHVNTRTKGCGLYLFDLAVFDAIRRTPRTAMRDEYEITDTIQIMVDDGLPVHVAEVVRWDVNVTFPPDLLACNLFELRSRGLDRLVGEGVEIHPQADLENVVVGDRAKIRSPIRLRNTVVFPDTQVAAAHDLESLIVTPEHQIDCRIVNSNRVL